MKSKFIIAPLLILVLGCSSMVFAQKKKAVSLQTTYSQAQLLKLADDKYSDGELPLGDGKYVTSGPKKGYIYLCNARSDEGQGGAQKSGPWIDSSSKTWNINEKLSIQGSVSWPNASFSNTTKNTTRTLIGNGLPTSHTTGTFPVSSTDPAHSYDSNPNSIKTQTLNLSLPISPSYSSTPNCMGGEVGVMLTGVALYNGFDALLRDAVANEVQDSCSGHPQMSGHYHYHGLSSCVKDTSVSTVLGYALDGYPITGPRVATDKYLTTEDLDECHGIKSDVVVNGVKKSMYHYVMTQDFPYSVSCFRGKPVSMQVIKQGIQGQQNNQGGMPGTPPAEAITACQSKSSGSSCSFTTPNGTINGTCGTPPNSSTLACKPAGAQ